MLDKTVDGIDYWCINCDHQALSRSQAKGAKILSIGATATRGLGAGGDPAKGQLAAEENMAELEKIVEGADLIFITAGMVRKNITIRTKGDEFLNACSRTFILPTYNAKRPTRSGRWHRIGGCSGGRPNGAVGRGAHDWDSHQALRL